MRFVFWMPALVALVAVVACAAKPAEEKSVPVNPLSTAPGAASSTVPGNPERSPGARRRGGRPTVADEARDR